jgi:hypothetical protein
MPTTSTQPQPTASAVPAAIDEAGYEATAA